MAEDANRGEDIVQPAADPAAVHAALGAAGATEEARLYLREQTKLAREQAEVARLQAEDLRREDSVRHWSLRVRHISDVLKMSFELAIAVIGLAIVTAIASAIWNAAEDHGLVVEAFQVPPELSQRGLTGQTVAAQVLDKLAAMQAATDSERPAKTYQNNWGDDLKVEIPETGVSISDLSRFLRQWLGNQTRISGEVFRTQTGLTITARVGANAGDRFSGTDTDLDRLLQQSAEAIYRRTQPYRLAAYLVQHDRRDDALAILIALADGPPGQDRIWADHDLQFDLMDIGDVPGAVARAQDAVRIAPDSGMAWDGLGETERSLGHDEAALAAFEHALPLSRRNSDGEPAGEAASLVGWQEGYVARYRGDFRVAAQEFERGADADASLGGTSISASIESVRDFGRDHDAQAVDATEMAVQAAVRAARARFGIKAKFSGGLPGAELVADIGLGRWLQASGPGQAIQAHLAEAASTKTLVSGVERLKRSLANFAYAKAMTGDMAGAMSMIRVTPLDCYDCVRMRGKIAAAALDWPGAERWFAESVRQAPDIPFAYADWGEALLTGGDLEGAIAKFKLANEKGPHFADPLEMWGEALTRENRSDLALAKFAEAAKYAPNWGRLHLKWGEALLWSGNKADAAKQFGIAGTLDLSPPEISELARVRAIHG
jgi:tetratricopeptide (TPR) repeat protein